MSFSLLLFLVAGGMLIFSFVVLVFVILAGRKTREQHHRTSAETLFFHALQNSTIDSIYLKDTRHRVMMANDIFYTHLNRTPEDVIGYTDVDFFGEEFGRRTMAEEKKLFETGEPVIAAVEERVIETGHRHYTLTTKVPVEEDGRIVGLLGITREFTAIAKLQEELEYHATHDSLTGLCNRASITYDLHDVIQTNSPVAVLFIDMDNFKQFNDQYGHDFGDELLKLIARRMELTLRKDDLIGRISGDEFVVVLRGIHSRREAEIATRKLIDAFKLPFSALGHSVTCSFSIGIMCTAANPMAEEITVEDLIRCADHAMYAVKKQGKGGYQFYRELRGDS